MHLVKIQVYIDHAFRLELLLRGMFVDKKNFTAMCTCDFHEVHTFKFKLKLKVQRIKVQELVVREIH